MGRGGWFLDESQLVVVVVFGVGVGVGVGVLCEQQDDMLLDVSVNDNE